MAMMAVAGVGRIGKDPEMTYTPSGTAVTKFSLAVDGFRKDEEGNRETHWFDVVAFGKTAEFVAQYLDKGARVSLSGRLEQDRWTDKQSGQARSRIVVVAEHVQSEESRTEAEGRRAAVPARGAPQPDDYGADDPGRFPDG